MNIAVIMIEMVFFAVLFTLMVFATTRKNSASDMTRFRTNRENDKIGRNRA